MKQPVAATRTLVSEALIAQLTFAAVIGVIALALISSVSSWVVKDNLNDWSERWVSELEALGAGLYLDTADPSFVTLSNFTERYEEVLYVRYYDPAGEVLYVEGGQAETLPFQPLEAASIKRLADRIERNDPHLLDESIAPIVRISRAIATEAIASVDLFAAESLDELKTEKSIVGYVELGLDYGRYDRELGASIFVGSVFVTLAFFVLALVGSLLIRRAIKPLSQLEEPLQKLADGNLDIEVPESPHREIAAIGNALRVAVKNIQERDQNLRQLANFDQLTGLHNRHSFVAAVEEDLGSSEAALLFIDLDQFKYVNDSVGHKGGDDVLSQAAERLRQTVRPADLIARFGGDEFVMYVRGVTVERAERIANQLLNDLKEFPLAYGGKSFNVGCSVGVARVEKETVYTAMELISQANVACRHAKSGGRNRVHLYEQSDGELESIVSDLEWQSRIKHAIEHDQFELNFQPILHVASNSVNHYEVLLRLKEDGSYIFPDAFLPAAQRFGMLKDIDRWVLKQAIKELAEYRRNNENLIFSINITGSMFVDGEFPKLVIELINRHKVPATALVFEITEQVAIGSLADAVPQIEELVERGCQFSVDDFGTGYSSLSYLKRLPVQYIKIDGVFIKQLTASTIDQTIVRAIAEIARIMGKKTVAEFVGDEETLELIKALGIDYAQGFYTGKPNRKLLDASTDNVVDLKRSAS